MKNLVLLIYCFSSVSTFAQSDSVEAATIASYENLIELMENKAEEEENPLLKEHYKTIALFAQDTSYGFSISAEDYENGAQVLQFFKDEGTKWETYTHGPRPLMMSFKSPSDGKYSYYWLGLPKNYDPDKEDYPLYLELHGSGGGSNNNPRKMLFQPLQPEVKGVAAQGYRKEGFWVFPWGRGDKGYRDQSEQDIFEVLADFDSRFKTALNSQYMYGFSMGGMGTLYIAQKTMERWAALGSYSGAMRDADTEKAKKFIKTPVWMAWGEDERWAEGNRKIRDLFLEAGVELKWIEIEDVGHKYLGEYQEDLMDWLKQHKK